MSDTKLGQLITGEAQRDAIHVAIAPVVAAVPLAPGAHVGLLADGTAGYSTNPIGIVDPFLQQMVKAGEKFWLCLYQQTITGMRHHWQHPAFTDAKLETAPAVDKAASERWLRDFCGGHHNAPCYDDLIAAATGKPLHGWESYGTSSIEPDYFIIRGTDAGGEIPAEMWTHLEIVTGQKFPNKPSYFSCSC